MRTRSTVTLTAFRLPIPRSYYCGLAGASIGTAVGTWWALSAVSLLPETFIAPPGKVISATVTMFGTQDFAVDIFASAGRVGVAFLISGLVAIPLGILMSSFKWIEAIIEPIVDFVRYVPVPALLPIFILWFGIGEAPKFLVLFFGTFFQLVLLIMDDADNVPSYYFDIPRTMGASTLQLLRHVLVPYLLPQIYDRLRVTLGWCWTYLVIAELIAVQRGVGHAIKEAQRFNASDQLIVSCVVLGIIGLVTDYLAKCGYRWLFPHANKSALHA